METKKLKVLLIIEQCNPDWSSVPLVGYRFYETISQLVDTHLVTHERNQSNLEKILGREKVTYIRESSFTKPYYQVVSKITGIGRVNWPLRNALTYPIYNEFNQQVYQQFKTVVEQGKYDLVHVITPMMPRYPVKLIKACKHTPFILGPVNGGVPFPSGFRKVARQESAQFNFLRALGRYLIPGYIETYRKADQILAGSTYTLKLLKQLFSIPDQRIQLFYENGISQDFLLNASATQSKDQINLLFVGRLVPYKGADMLIEAISQLETAVKEQITVTIVGDGSEKKALENQVGALGIKSKVTFTGWVTQQETREYYQKADLFCFPSVREFGGAVVLEAMACGLPCIVVNNGGIGEYVTEETGYKIDPNSREYVVKQLSEKITNLINDSSLRKKMSLSSVERAKEFIWSNKAQTMLMIYNQLLTKMN